MRGIDFGDDAIPLDLIQQVGPGGTFMDQEHTARHFRRELWFPRLLDRDFYDSWLAGGAKTMGQRCREEKRRLLREHTPQPLPDDVEKEVARVLAAARRDLQKRGLDWRAAA